MTAGISIALLTGSETERDLAPLARLAMDATPPGRVAAFLWRSPSLLASSPPTEATLTRLVLGDAPSRGEDKTADPWLYYAGVAVRHYARGSHALTFAYGSTALLFRRQGPPPYRRLQDGPQPPEADRLETLHPAFTRDVANNTWMLPAEDGITRLAARIAVLMSWSDEDIVIVEDGQRSTRNDLRRLGLSTDILGIPTKVPYEWHDLQVGPAQLPLRLG